MAALTTTDYDVIYQEFWLPIFESQFNEQSVLMDEIIMARSSRSVKNLQAHISMEVESWAGFASAAESANLIVPNPGQYAESIVPLRYHYMAFDLTGQAIDSTAQDAAAAAQAFTREMTTKINVFHRQTNRMMHGDGSGVLCLVDGAPSGNTITVDAAYGIANDTNGHLFLSKGVNLEIWSAKTGGSQRGTCTIVSVTPGSGASTSAIITVDSVPGGTATNDFIFLKGARGIEMMGLLGGIDKNTFVSTLQSVAYASNTWWGAQVRDAGDAGGTAGTSIPLTRNRINVVLEDCVFIGGSDIRFILGPPAVQRTYGDMAARERIVVNEVELDNGWMGLSYNGIPWMADFYAPADRAKFIDPSTIEVHELNKPQWMDRGDGIMRQVTDSGGDLDIWRSRYYWYSELGFTKRMANGDLRDIETI
jgi:hypothetical protein